MVNTRGYGFDNVNYTSKDLLYSLILKLIELSKEHCSFHVDTSYFERKWLDRVAVSIKQAWKTFYVIATVTSQCELTYYNIVIIIANFTCNTILSLWLAEKAIISEEIREQHSGGLFELLPPSLNTSEAFYHAISHLWIFNPWFSL